MKANDQSFTENMFPYFCGVYDVINLREWVLLTYLVFLYLPSDFDGISTHSWAQSKGSIFLFIEPDTKIYFRDKTDNLYTYLQTCLVRCTMHNIFLIALKQTHQSIKLSKNIICIPSRSFTNDVSQNLVFVNISNFWPIPSPSRLTSFVNDSMYG